jgi:hypothetical protein
MSESEIVRLASAGTLQEAHAWRMALEREGIRCRVVGEYLAAGYGLGVVGMSPEVWVHGEDLEKARAVLAARAASTSPSGN